MRYISILSACSYTTAFSLFGAGETTTQVIGGAKYPTDNTTQSLNYLDIAKQIYGDNLLEENAEGIKDLWNQLESSGLLEGYLSSLQPQADLQNQTTTKSEIDLGEWDDLITSDQFPNYQLRVKENNPEILGIDTVKQYTGYIDIAEGDKHLFYWFFESRNDPENDPVVIWLNGGPGCSSTTGLFFELGPSLISEDLKPIYNPYSWNSNASVIFLDQPIGVGYSYSGGSTVGSTDLAAKDFYVFLELFFQKFEKFRHLPFHISGESYGGHYIPKFASEIVNHPERTFNLTSVLIGNGLTDTLTQIAWYGPMACGQGGYPSVLSPEICNNYGVQYKICHPIIETCYKTGFTPICILGALCDKIMVGSYLLSGRNLYDIRETCDGACYPGETYSDNFLSLDKVKNAVGADLIGNFTGCSQAVGTQFLLTGDEARPFQQYVTELLHKEVPVLIYAGDKDYICNWLGNKAWTDALQWDGAEAYSHTPTEQWITNHPVENGSAGTVRSANNLTFLRIFDAGHMVPHNQPENALTMLNSWIFSGAIN